MKYEVTEHGEFWVGQPRFIEASSRQEALRIAANLSDDAGEYALDNAAMRYAITEID